MTLTVSTTSGGSRRAPRKPERPAGVASRTPWGSEGAPPTRTSASGANRAANASVPVFSAPT